MFIKDKLKKFHLNPDTLYPKVMDRPPPVDPKVNEIQAPTCLGPIDTVKGWLKSINPFGSSSKPAPIPIATTEEEADAVDALAPIYDMLDIKPQIWLIFEKMTFKVYDPKLGKPVDKVYNKQPRNLRGPIFVDFATKEITKARVKVHRTVSARMHARNADGSSYVPRALFPDKTAISLDAGLTGGGQAKFEWVD